MPLPKGVSINASSGALVGTPDSSAAVDGEATDYTFTVQARDSAGGVSRKQFTITCYPAPTLVLVTPAGTVGAAYTGSATASNGSGSYAYAVSAGALPTGLALNAGTGAITGTPSVAGTYIGTITVTANLGGQTSEDFSITIA